MPKHTQNKQNKDDPDKEKLLRFLERRAWNPVLRASAQRYAGSEAKRLERVRRKTESQRERYHAYRSAGEVLKRFKDDLTSTAAKKTNADLEALKLPTQKAVADEFFSLADRLGVQPDAGARRPHKPHPPHPWHKSKPKDRAKAAAELKKKARSGDQAALRTLRNAPAKWARDYAEQLTGGLRHAGASRGHGSSSAVKKRK